MRLSLLVSIVFVILNTSYRETTQRQVSILFVGNSLTYTNNLPELVASLARNHNIKTKTEMLAFPNYGLIDHWNEGKLQKLLTTKHYDYVVVQQGPSSQAEGRAMLLEYDKKIKQLCDKNGSKLAFYMVWPSKAYYHTFDGVIRNHKDAAQATNALLCPVGEVWKAYFDTTQDFSYYGPDQFHPSLVGSQVAAQVIFNSLIKL